MDVKTIRIIKCSGADKEGLLLNRIAELESLGFKILFDDSIPDPAWPYCATDLETRKKALTSALLEEESDAIWWARGGYGASDLLPSIPWSTVKASKPKPIIGFSDVCAAQSALYVMTGRPSIHGPMPASSLWRLNGGDDIDQLLDILSGRQSSGFFDLSSNKKHAPIEGKLFGGCLAVLTSLIGTPYLPKSLAGHILMFEDVSENPGRVMRMLNQWQQSGSLAGVKAIVFGSFTDLGNSLPDHSPVLFDEIYKRFELPVFTSFKFGHLSPNTPFVVGSNAMIGNQKLTWKLSS